LPSNHRILNPSGRVRSAILRLVAYYLGLLHYAPSGRSRHS
jgi:hypothetical protein